MTQQTILVVDDEAPMRKLLLNNLKASGYAVRSAADGTEALKLLEENRFDLLLLDINLPGPNGLQVLEAMRHDVEMPVLMLSGRGRERDKVEALDRGADDYLTKPFGIAELLARVKALLRRASFGRRAASAPYRYKGWRSTSRLGAHELRESRFHSRGASSKCWPTLHAMEAKSCCIGRYCKQCGADSTGTNPSTCGRSFSGSAARSN